MLVVRRPLKRVQDCLKPRTPQTCPASPHQNQPLPPRGHRTKTEVD
jgi:hypothetical protein